MRARASFAVKRPEKFTGGAGVDDGEEDDMFEPGPDDCIGWHEGEDGEWTRDYPEEGGAV